MPRVIYELTFSTLVHFGDEFKGLGLEKNKYYCSSNTFFSALCCEYSKYEKDLSAFKKLFEDGNLLISSLFPFSNKRVKNEYIKVYFLPKPIKCLVHSDEDKDKLVDAKKLKKIKFVPSDRLNEYHKLPAISNHFGGSVTIEKNHLKEVVSEKEEAENADLFAVTGYKFKNKSDYNNSEEAETCGLYFILEYKDYKDKELISNILDSLQYEGIGGKRSVGYGKFSFCEVNYDGFKVAKNYNENLLISNLLVKEKEELKIIKNSDYSIISTNGFVNFREDTPYKRKLNNMIEAGSVLQGKINGEIRNVENIGNSKEVWLYGKAMYL